MSRATGCWCRDTRKSKGLARRSDQLSAPAPARASAAFRQFFQCAAVETGICYALATRSYHDRIAHWAPLAFGLAMEIVAGEAAGGMRSFVRRWDEQSPRAVDTRCDLAQRTGQRDIDSTLVADPPTTQSAIPEVDIVTARKSTP